MAKTVRAVYEDGIFRPLDKVKLPNHERIQLVILPVEEKISDLVKAQKRALKKYCGIIKSGPTDISTNHDKYLY